MILSGASTAVRRSSNVCRNEYNDWPLSGRIQRVDLDRANATSRQGLIHKGGEHVSLIPIAREAVGLLLHCSQGYADQWDLARRLVGL